MQLESCELPVDGQTFEVPVPVASHVADLRDSMRGSVVVVGEAMRLCNESVDLVEELVNAAHVMTAGQLARCHELIRQRNGLRAAALHRRKGEG